MDRKVAHVESQFSSRLYGKLEADGQSFPDFKAVFDHFRQYDPSRSGAYTTWLIKTYCEAGFLFEDLGKAKETLQWFDDVKRRLSVERRNIADYPTLVDLWKVVKPFVEMSEEVEPSKREQRRKEQEEVYKETVFLEDRDDFRVVIPQTEKASKWWGRGTRWCTAANEDNMFSDYFKDAPLIIFDFKDGRKWQLWVTKYGIQFMDENDEHLKRDVVETEISKVEHYLDDALHINRNAIEYIPEHKLTRDACFSAVEKNGMALMFVPEKLRDREMCMAAALQSNWVLEYVPVGIRDLEMCSMSVAKNGWSLRHVPDHLRDREMCLTAVRQYGKVLAFVSERFLDREMCMTAVGADGTSLKFVPRCFCDREMFMVAIEQNGLALDHVPAHQRDREICMTAVKQKWKALKFVPMEFRDLEMCEVAVEANVKALEFVPEYVARILLDVKKKESLITLMEENSAGIECGVRRVRG